MSSQRKTTLKKAAMIEALEKSLGVVTTACKQVGIDRGTHYKWLKNDSRYREKVSELTNMALDFAESQLHLQMQNGNVAAIIFYLKTKGKSRGYIEKSEYDVTTGGEQITEFKIKYVDEPS